MSIARFHFVSLLNPHLLSFTDEILALYSEDLPALFATASKINPQLTDTDDMLVNTAEDQSANRPDMFTELI